METPAEVVAMATDPPEDQLPPLPESPIIEDDHTMPTPANIIVVMGNPSLVHGPDLEVAVHNVADPVTQPKTGLNTGRT